MREDNQGNRGRQGKTQLLDRLSGAVGLYSACAAILCFWRLGAVGVVRMEGMVADGARRMLQSGEWIVPRVYGEIYTYKPALAYWLAALPRSLADPPPIWLLRFPFALSAFAMGLLVLFVIARVAGPRLGFFCALSSVSGILFLQKVRLAEFDGILAAGVGVAVAAACANMASEKASGPIWLLGYAGLAFGFLAKGVPALMCYAPGLLAAAVVNGRFRRLFELRHLVAAAFFALSVGGYLAAAYQAEGSAAFEQPLLESKVRGFSWGVKQEGPVLSELDRADTRVDQVQGDPKVTLLRTLVKPVQIWAAFFPWGLLLPFAFGRGRAESLATPSGRLALSAQAFLAAGVLVFMVIPTHQMRYYLPLAVPVAILAAGVLAERDRPERRDRRVLAVCAVGAILGATAMILIGSFSDTPPVPFANRGLLVVGGAICLFWPLVSLRTGRGAAAPALLLLAVVAGLTTESLASQVRRGSKRDLRPQAAILERLIPAGETVWVLGPSDLAGKSSSLYFYLKRPIETFLPPDRMPPSDSYCLLSSDRLHELREPAGFVFEEIARAPDPWRVYLLGRCSRADREPSTDGLTPAEIRDSFAGGP